MWNTENLTDMGIAGVYSALRNWGPAGSGWTGTYGFDSWGMTGMYRYSNGNMTNGAITVTSGLFKDTWKKLYEGVHRANDAIVNIPIKSPVSAEKKGRLVAEAKFLRAFFYFRLNELWRGVPYYDTPIDSEEATKGQETEAFIWGKVIDDLNDCIAEPNFPDRYTNSADASQGRATKGAAYALRGKAYMMIGEYGKAVLDFDKVGQCGYNLYQGGYKSLFTEANEYCEEMIFSVQNIAEVNYGSRSQWYCGTRSAHSTVGTNSWGEYQVSPDLVDLYENADGTAFNWDDVIPGYSTMEAKQREVFFLRDTLKADGTPIHPRITTEVSKRLANFTAATKALYLPNGNEARIKKAYEGRDPRLAQSVITPYSEFIGYDGGTSEATLVSRWPIFGNSVHYNANPAGQNDLAVDASTYLFYFHRKFVFEGYGVVSREACPINEPLIRYADVLLMWAEALLEQDDLPGAAAKVNLVRDRVGVKMPAVKYSDKDDLRNKIRNERRIEFLNEGINFFDEMRWRTLKDTKYKGGVNEAQQPWGATAQVGAFRWPEENNLYVWPIPQEEVQKNKNLVPTPGWKY